MTDLRTFTLTALCLAGITCVEAQTVETVPTVQTDSIADTSIPQQWNLQTCIDYALQHNITIRRNRISAQSTQEDVKTAKADLFPSLNASVRKPPQYHQRYHHQRRQHHHQPEQDIL